MRIEYIHITTDVQVCICENCVVYMRTRIRAEAYHDPMIIVVCHAIRSLWLNINTRTGLTFIGQIILG